MVSVCDRTLLPLEIQAIASQMRAKGSAIAVLRWSAIAVFTLQVSH